MSHEAERLRQGIHFFRLWFWCQWGAIAALVLVGLTACTDPKCADPPSEEYKKACMHSMGI